MVSRMVRTHLQILNQHPASDAAGHTPHTAGLPASGSKGGIGPDAGQAPVNGSNGSGAAAGAEQGRGASAGGSTSGAQSRRESAGAGKGSGAGGDGRAVRLPFRVGMSEDRNKRWRRTMEDSHAFVYGFGGVHGQGFFGVFDGHAGKHSAEWCGEHFHEVSRSAKTRCMSSTFLDPAHTLLPHPTVPLADAL